MEATDTRTGHGLLRFPTELLVTRSTDHVLNRAALLRLLHDEILFSNIFFGKDTFSPRGISIEPVLLDQSHAYAVPIMPRPHRLFNIKLQF